MSVNTFLSKDNIELIWDVIMDEDIFRNRTKDIIININNVFNKLIKDFYDSEKQKFNNLIEMNKQFITIMLNYINNYILKNNSHQQIYQSSPKNDKLNIYQTDLITSEDIQKNRASQFEKELQLKQQEFTDAISLPVPPIPKFNDEKDEPIGEMETALKQIIAQRNYDIATFNNNISKNENLNTNLNSKWLQSQETSIKSEKINNNKSINQSTNQNIKYIKIDNEETHNIDIQQEVIDLNKKQLTWSENNVTIEYNEIDNNQTNPFTDNNIFKKLKMLPNNSTSNNLFNKNQNFNPILSENKIVELENKVDNLSNKMDIIIKLLENKNIM